MTEHPYVDMDGAPIHLGDIVASLITLNFLCGEAHHGKGFAVNVVRMREDLLVLDGVYGWGELRHQSPKHLKVLGPDTDLRELWSQCRKMQREIAREWGEASDTSAFPDAVCIGDRPLDLENPESATIEEVIEALNREYPGNSFHLSTDGDGQAIAYTGVRKGTTGNSKIICEHCGSTERQVHKRGCTAPVEDQ